MKHLKKRFPIYSRLLHLYPASYRRQYGGQMLQTLADMLDAPNISRTQKTAIKMRAMLDVLKTVPQQRLIKNQQMVLRHPSRYLLKRLIVIALLLMPMLASVAISSVRPQLFAGPSSFANFWQSNAGLLLWLEILPLLATGTAIVTIIAWSSTAHERRSRKKKSSRVPKILFGVLTLVALAGVLFVGFVTTTYFKGYQRLSHSKAASLEELTNNPNLACKLLPLTSAKIVLGPRAFVNNTMYEGPNADPTYSGLLTNTKTTHSTMCNYYTGDMWSNALGIVVNEFLTDQELQKQRQNFLNNGMADNPYLSRVTFKGYEGYIYSTPVYLDPSDSVSQGYTKNYSAGISLYIGSKQILISGPSLDTVYRAMNIALKNMKNQDSPASPVKNALTPEENYAVETLLMGKQLTIPAGTTYTFDIKNRTNNVISGTFKYSTGLHGSFTARLEKDKWTLTSYRVLN